MTQAAVPTTEGAPMRPVLHLSGPRLRSALESLIKASETVGGIERFAAAVALKSQIFQARLAEDRARSLERAAFEEIAPLMATVRRRIRPLLAAEKWDRTRTAIAALLEDAHVPGTGDGRIAEFERVLGGGERPRYLRDLAAELLHNVFPEHYPLMTRWVWDARTNTGVLREIWHAEGVPEGSADRIVIDVPDSHETFLVLREEVSQLLSANGVFRDMLWYVDLLCAHVYASYIDHQGSAWLKADFMGDGDPLEHTRRILGLDRVGGGRARALDGEARDPASLRRIG